MNELEHLADDEMTPRQAAPDTLLGLLQRGRGLGWLQAARDPKVGRAMLLECLSEDRCWDAQCESRSLYYGSLAHRLGVASSDVAPMLDPDDGSYFVVHLQGVLFELARRGDDEAIGALISELSRRSTQYLVLERLGNLARPDVLAGLAVHLERSLEHDDLVDAVSMADVELPWDRWAAQSTKIRQAVAEARAPRDDEYGRWVTESSFAGLLDDPWFRRRLHPALVDRFTSGLSDDEIATLRSAATDLSTERGQMALVGLEVRGDPSAVEAVADVFKRNETGTQRSAARQYLTALDAAVTLPLARQWNGVDDDRSGIASHLFRLHAEAEDVPLVRAALARAWAGDRDTAMISICDLMEALSRHPDLDPYDELIPVFEEVEYSGARKRAVAVLAKSNASFVEQYGEECLWDCEAAVRIEAIRVARLDARPARERIEALVHDPYEQQDVVNAAVQRLTGATS